MSSGRAVTIGLIAWLIKKILLYKSGYYPEPISYGKNKIKVELDFSNKIEKITGAEVSVFGKKADLGSLTFKVDELDVEWSGNCFCWCKWARWCCKK